MENSRQIYQAPRPNYPNDWSTWLSGWVGEPSAYVSGATIGKVVFPAQMRNAETKDPKFIAALERDHRVKCHQLTVLTHDNASLDTVEISSLYAESLKPSKRYYIVKYNVNGTYYEDQLPGIASYARKYGCSVVGFNYRGVGHGTPSMTSDEQLITDGIAQVQRLLENGVRPYRILLDGFSLGAVYATIVAQYFHDQQCPVNLFSDRSLSKISKVPAAALAGEHSFFAPAFGSTFHSSLAAPKWDLDPGEAYKKIPAAYKGYMFVAKKSNIGVGDGVIPHPASIHKAVKGNANEQGGFYCKMLARNTLFSGHNASRSDLVCEHNPQSNGEDVFEEFYEHIMYG